jgi:ubiquinone/menaquinone biosynthesis C-methylase UbiE
VGYRKNMESSYNLVYLPPRYFIRWYEIGLLHLKGDEKVLDVACGRGFVLNGLAKRLTAGGKAYGADIFDDSIQSGNSIATTMGNACRMGLGDRVEVVFGFAEDLPFPDNTFDCLSINFVIP